MTQPPYNSMPSDLQAAFRPDMVVPPPGAIQLGQEISAAQARRIAEDQARIDVLHQLGFPDGPDQLMDQFADHLAEVTGMAYAFVNLFYGDQTFVGLHMPDPERGLVPVGRSMGFDRGWCPVVVEQKKALPLFDVYASPRFAGNYVVNAVGIRSYMGAPLIHEETGIALGTVCTIDPEPRTVQDARHLIARVKDVGAEVKNALPASAPAR
ncbi:GAF domain-containing protein [Streptomyces sp. NPDC006335]|uniref:GAF domain-containing protein n=1 Tax=Streptomyces sp. NPDC006335 TaxID=3156895 RepID=UPI0033BDDBFB